MFGRKDKSVRVARPQAQVVHGVEVRKMPVGKYFEVMERMGGIVADLLDAAFPGKKPGEVLQMLTTMTAEEFRALAVRLLAVLPDKLLGILCAIMDADAAYVRDNLTPAELMRVWQAFWALNDLTDFFSNVRSVLPRALGTKKESIGSNG